MKKLLLLLLLIPFLGTSQGTFTAPVGYNTGAPTAAPSGVGTRWRFDLLTGKKYTWNPDAVAWDEDPRGIDQISGCSAPLYTPGYSQSTFAVNACSPTPELYQYTGSSWVKLNAGGSYAAGANIDITGNVISLTGNLPVERFNGGTNAASNTYWRGDGLWAGLPGFLTSLNGLSPAIQTFATSTAGTDFSIQSFGSTHTFRLPTASATNRGALSSADWSTFNSKDPSSTNEIQTLSIAGQDLSLSLGGGTVTIPAGSSLGTGFTAGGGSGTIPDGAIANTGLSRFEYGYDSNPDAIAWIYDNGAGYLNSIVNNGDGLNFLSSDAVNGSSLSFGISGGSGAFGAVNATLDFGAKSGGVISLGTEESFLTFSSATNTVFFQDDRGTPLGMEYIAEYPGILTNDRSFLDVGLAKQLIASENGALGTGFTDGGGSGTIPASTTATAQGDFSLLGSATVADDAGIISIISGNSDEAKGGDFVLSAGNGASPGDFYMTAGNATAVDGLGGQLSILAGNNTNGFGGVLDLRAGNGGEAGGAVSITAGDGVTGTGGNVVLLPGNGSTDANNGKVIAYGNGIVLPSLTASERNAISILQVGTTIFTTNATATDGSTGVLQTWNGSTWKNHW